MNKEFRSTDRRSGTDRRRVNTELPPGKHDRRRRVEARKPEVVELEMTNSEWIALTDDAFAATEPLGLDPLGLEAIPGAKNPGDDRD